jgi:translation initiation factor IF-2
MNISDLAKKLGVTQKAVRETAKKLKFSLKSTAKTVSEQEALAIEKFYTTGNQQPTKTDVKEQEKKSVQKKIKDDDILLPELEKPLTKTEAIIEEIEEDLEREIRKTQKKQKMTSSLKAGEKEKGIERQKTEGSETVPLTSRKGDIYLPSVISVKEFSEKIGIPVNKVVAELMKNGLIVTINHKIDFDTAAIIGASFGVELKKMREEGSSQDLMLGNLEKLLENEDPACMVERPPIVSIMGHVDHGKTKLLDYIRKTNVIDTEVGGITQKIGAYQVTYKDKKISFLDTPGHEAFTAMRARGAKVTDIAILVVAADEGVKPQTQEAYDHLKDADVPVIVAINKIDKPGANIEMTKNQLAELGLVPEEWGGSTIMVPVSAVTGQGVDNLLEMILLVAEINPLKANPNRPAIGTVIESNLDPKLGPVATILINTGTLYLMNSVVVGETFGRIKVMFDHNLNKIESAGPSTPVEIAGLSEVPSVGDILQVEPSLDVAKKKAMEIKSLRTIHRLKNTMGSGMSDIIAQIHSGQLKTLKIVLKADSKGSLEAIRTAIEKIQSTEVEAKVIYSNVGNITETDVLMAAASGGIVMGFNVAKNVQVDKAAERENVEVRTYRVIYQMLDDIKKILLGLLDPEIRENVIGEGEVLAIFLKDRKGMIIGCRVTKGKAEPKVKIRIIRKDKLAGEGDIVTIRREKDNVSEVKEGYECGIRYDGSAVAEIGDILEFFKIEKVKKESL